MENNTVNEIIGLIESLIIDTKDKMEFSKLSKDEAIGMNYQIDGYNKLLNLIKIKYKDTDND